MLGAALLIACLVLLLGALLIRVSVRERAIVLDADAIDILPLADSRSMLQRLRNIRANAAKFTEAGAVTAD